MADTMTMTAESERQGGFYVPRFELKIAGAGLPRDVLFDVREMSYEDSLEAIDSFTMTVNNWDDEERVFKYIGSERAEQLEKGHRDEPRLTLFEPCGKEVELQMGYGANLVTMLKGSFTTMLPTFADTAPTLKVTALNVLHELRRSQYTTTWENKRDSDIALDISKRMDNGRKRFPLPIVIDKSSLNTEKKIPKVSQQNQYDIDFLFERAMKRGYVVFVQEADKKKGTPRQLYFGPSQQKLDASLRPKLLELRWGASMIEFKPKIATANQVTSVTVKGWNRTHKTTISRTVTIDDKRLGLNDDLKRILACGGRKEIVVKEPIFTNCEARERAIAILLEQIKRIVTADVKVVGLPGLRAGQQVMITHLGARLSGLYLVIKTTHTIDDNGYITTFSCRREDPPKGGGG